MPAVSLPTPQPSVPQRHAQQRSNWALKEAVDLMNSVESLK